MNREAASVLAYWFTELSADKWFAHDAAVDAEIARRFGPLHARFLAQVPEDWTNDARALLAAVLVLDQFSRNLFRDRPHAFCADARALTLSKRALVRGFDRKMGTDEREFVYMPFMHSEDLGDQETSVALFTNLGDAKSLDFAKRHRDVIARFGRFPQRNAALGRASTPEEVEFLKQPGNLF